MKFQPPQGSSPVNRSSSPSRSSHWVSGTLVRYAVSFPPLVSSPIPWMRRESGCLEGTASPDPSGSRTRSGCHYLKRPWSLCSYRRAHARGMVSVYSAFEFDVIDANSHWSGHWWRDDFQDASDSECRSYLRFRVRILTIISKVILTATPGRSSEFSRSYGY